MSNNLKVLDLFRMIRTGEIVAKENWVIVMKTITWRISGSIITFVLATGATGSAKVGALYMVVRGLVGVIWYMCHEKIWFWIQKRKNQKTLDINAK